MIQSLRFSPLSLFFLALVFMCSPTPASAQVELASSIETTETHAWAVYRNTSDEILLVHLPPRDGDPDATPPIKPSAPGELHPVRPLSKMPDAIAAIKDRVFLVFPPVFSDGKRIRRVFSGRAVPIPIGSSWGFLPSGLLDSQPIITAKGELVDLVATSEKLWCLLKDGDQYTLLNMTESGWNTVALPESSAEEKPTWMISALGKELIAIDATDIDHLRPSSMGEGVSDWLTLDWAPLSIPPGPYSILAGTRSLIVVDRENDKARLRTWSQSGVFTIASGLDLPADIELAVLDSVNRLVGIAKHQPPPSTDTPPTKDKDSTSTPLTPKAAPGSSIEIWEIDLSDGSVLYAGDPVVAVAVSAAEYRFLVGMMILIMLGVLVVVIMPDKAETMQIPDGFALADPGRRLSATIIDVFLIVFAVGMIFDVRVIEILTLSVIVRPDVSWLVIPSVLVSGVVVMSLFEWLLGATPGKLLMGMRVVKAKPGAMEHIEFWAALVRNVIKWILPPVVALALIDPETLHRGDRATRTLVVVPTESPSPSEHSDHEG